MRVRTAPDFKAPALRSRVRSSAARGDARGGDERRGAPVDESPSTSSGTVAELVALMSRFAPSGVAMLRGGSTAIMHHASVAGGGSGVRPASWSPSLTLSVELMSGFLGGIQIDPDEANALISGDGDAQKAESLRAYVRSLRAMMGVGVRPLPGTLLSPEVAIPGGYPARWLVPPRPSASSASGAPRRRVVAWIHGGAFLFCGGTTTHARQWKNGCRPRVDQDAVADARHALRAGRGEADREQLRALPEARKHCSGLAVSPGVT